MAKRQQKTKLGCLFWLALALLIVVVFLYNKETINTVLVNTGLFDVIEERRSRRNPDQSGPEAPGQTAIPRETETRDPEPRPETAPEPETRTESEPGTDSTPPEPEVVIRLAPEAEQPEEPATEPAAESSSEKPNLRKARLFFVSVNQEGEIQLTGVVRPVYYDNAPLRQTLLTLLEGQAGSELSSGLLTMIPQETSLRNVYVKGSTAFVDLSDQFRFNPLGQAGLTAAVQQIVYTATEFSNISEVQLLIEGERIEYLSSEGPLVGRPISRESFLGGLL